MRYSKILFTTAVAFITIITVSFINKSNDSLFSVVNSTISADTLSYPDEKHIQNVQQLTFGGDNAEAYFSFDGKWIIFRANFEGIENVYAAEIKQ